MQIAIIFYFRLQEATQVSKKFMLNQIDLLKFKKKPPFKPTVFCNLTILFIKSFYDIFVINLWTKSLYNKLADTMSLNQFFYMAITFLHDDRGGGMLQFT